MYEAQVPKDKIVLLVIEALSGRAKSQSTLKGVVRFVQGFVKFFIDTKASDAECKMELTGEKSVVLLHDYFESLADRGRTAPSAAKHALGVWAEALEIDWPLSHALINSATSVENNETPKQAPAMSLDTLRKLENMACDKLVTPFKRAFAAGIILMTYASLRFSDAQRIRSFEVNNDSIHGTLLNCKTRKAHGLFWPWARPREGITGPRYWVQPLIEMRDAYKKTNGCEPSFTFMRIDHAWQVVSADAAPYSSCRRKLPLYVSRSVILWVKLTRCIRRKTYSQLPRTS